MKNYTSVGLLSLSGNLYVFSSHKPAFINFIDTIFHSLIFFSLSVLFQSELGFGKIESYTKLDKLGEVSVLLTEDFPSAPPKIYLSV